MLEHNISLTLYEITRCSSSFTLHLFVIHIFSCLFTDTYQAHLWSQSNRRCWCSISGGCTTTKQGNHPHFSSSFAYICLHLHSQTLTSLHLGNDQIGDAGAQCLADALRHNTVIILITLHLSLTFIFISNHRHSSN
jgi:hypothetical protein